MEGNVAKSALLIIDMQNDFCKPEGYFGRRPEPHFKMMVQAMQPLVKRAIPNIRRLVEAAKGAKRPVIYIQHVLRPDYADACFPYWRCVPDCVEEKFLVEGNWGAEIVDELKPVPAEIVITKKGYGSFTHTALDLYLRNFGVTTCIVTGVGTSVCVETTTRQGADLNYYMIVVSDATGDSPAHEPSLNHMNRFFAEVMTTDQVIGMFQNLKK